MYPETTWVCVREAGGGGGGDSAAISIVLNIYNLQYLCICSKTWEDKTLEFWEFPFSFILMGDFSDRQEKDLNIKNYSYYLLRVIPTLHMIHSFITVPCFLLGRLSPVVELLYFNVES